MFDSSGDYCPRCGRDASKYGLMEGQCAACQDETIEYDLIARAGHYSGVLRDIILAYKFNDRTDLAEYLTMIGASVCAGCPFRDDIDYIVPVPLHWIRRLHRGYNQSLVIAKAFDRSSATINTDLVRVRYTKRQWNLSPNKRKSNVKGAFAVRRGHDFSSRKICLVDDITTSGATLNECARTLKDAGAEKVFAIVIAVAAQAKDDHKTK